MKVDPLEGNSAVNLAQNWAAQKVFDSALQKACRSDEMLALLMAVSLELQKAAALAYYLVGNLVQR